jgi:hypothetical protein
MVMRTLDTILGTLDLLQLTPRTTGVSEIEGEEVESLLTVRIRSQELRLQLWRGVLRLAFWSRMLS